MLDQVALIKRSMPDFPIISNGNVITYDDVVANRKFTGADGIMSAEGMLDNPALYLPRLGNVKDDGDADIDVHLPLYSPLNGNLGKCSSEGDKSTEKAIRKLQKKLREVEAIEKKVKQSGMKSINDDQRCKLHAKSKIHTELQNIESNKVSKHSTDGALSTGAIQRQTKSVKLYDLMKAADNKLILAREYLSLVRVFPTKIRSVVFHVRRMCKEILEQYQLMEECIASTTVDEVELVLS
jgi:tRNA-dihydrouridine synthase